MPNETKKSKDFEKWFSSYFDDEEQSALLMISHDPLQGRTSRRARKDMASVAAWAIRATSHQRIGRATSLIYQFLPEQTRQNTASQLSLVALKARMNMCSAFVDQLVSLLNQRALHGYEFIEFSENYPFTGFQRDSSDLYLCPNLGYRNDFHNDTMVVQALKDLGFGVISDFIHSRNKYGGPSQHPISIKVRIKF